MFGARPPKFNRRIGVLVATPANSNRNRADQSGALGNKLSRVTLFLLVLLVAACTRPPAANAGEELPAQAKALYVQYCAAPRGPPHGSRGEGQPNWKRPDAEGIYPAPPHDSSGHTWHHADEQLLAIIAQGGTMPKTQMPAFGATLTEAEIQLVLEYIKTFWGQEEREFQEQVTRQLQANR